MPSLPADKEVLEKYKNNAILYVDLRKPRNGKFHRKFFALIHVIYEAQDQYSTEEDLLVEIKLRAGHYQEHVTARGKMMYIPKSLSFDSMDGDEFAVFYDKAISTALKYLLPKTYTREALDQLIDKIISFA